MQGTKFSWKLILPILLIGAAVVMMQSCARILHRPLKIKKTALVLYPPLPDTPRYQYLTSFSGSDFFGNRTKFATFVLGSEEVAKMVKPYGMHISNGKLYVCDQGIGGIEILDFKKGSYRNFVPANTGALKTPLHCVTDSNEYLYVADRSGQKVMLYDSVGNFLYKFTDTGNFSPSEVTLYRNEVWATNPENHRLNIYDKSNRRLSRYFGEQYGVGDDGFMYSPFNVLVTDSIVYVTDFGDFKIKEYDHSGKFLKAIGSYGTGTGQFVRPKGIAVDKEDNLFVVDAGFENVQMFNKLGQLLMFFGGPYKGPGDMWLPSNIVVDYNNNKYFERYVDSRYKLNYIVVVSNQYGPDKISVYGSITPKY
jgi:DNA-binding beta-propeller fold protein YncE